MDFFAAGFGVLLASLGVISIIACIGSFSRELSMVIRSFRRKTR